MIINLVLFNKLKKYLYRKKLMNTFYSKSSLFDSVSYLNLDKRNIKVNNFLNKPNKYFGSTS